MKTCETFDSKQVHRYLCGYKSSHLVHNGEIIVTLLPSIERYHSFWTDRKEKCHLKGVKNRDQA